jgi:endonuclease/exonuclease/phosphatase family metal-dependent hydrolase
MRLVTWNVQHGVPTPTGPPDLAAGLPGLARLGADVVAVQELDRGRARTGRVDQPALVAEVLGAVPVFAPALRRGGEYGVGLFVRGAVGASEARALEGPGEPRVLLVAEVVLADGPWTVATTHLATVPAVARAQLAQVAALLEPVTGPVVLAGDLNLEPTAVRELLGPAGMVLAPGGPTHSARRTRPDRRIDHVAARGASIDVADVARLPISDHLAVVAELERHPERVEGPP